MGAAASTLLGRGAETAVPSPPAVPLATGPGDGHHFLEPSAPLATEPESTAPPPPPPPPVLSGDGHLLLEFPLAHPWDPKTPGLLAEGNFVFRNEQERLVVPRIPRGFGGLEAHAYPKGGLFREFQLSAKLDMMERLGDVHSIGVVREATAADGADEEDCAFCRLPLSSQRMRVLPCTHTVHKNCFDFSILRVQQGGVARRCPICRAIV